MHRFFAEYHWVRMLANGKARGQIRFDICATKCF
jgi:hypothetical protein